MEMFHFIWENETETELNKINFSRLVEDDAFMQYDLRNGNSVALAEFPPDLVNQHS